MSHFATWPGLLARRHLPRLIESLEGLAARLHESLARAVGDLVANVFHELSYLATTSSRSATGPSGPVDRAYLHWDEERDFDDRDRDSGTAGSAPITPASRWLRALSVGCQAAAWWLARSFGRFPVLSATGLGLTAVLVSYVTGPVVGVGLAGVGGALLHLLGLSEALRDAAAVGD